MNTFFQAVGFAATVTLPSLLLLLFGIFLRRRGQIGTQFCEQAIKLVFNYALPFLLFGNIVAHEIHFGEQSRLLAAGFITTLILFLGAEIYAWRCIEDVRDKGVFVQDVFRSNMAILGLAFVQSAYGSAGLAGGAVYMGIITIFYNILAVITLSRSQSGSRIAGMGKAIVLNPLIIALVLGIAVQQAGITVPKPLLAAAHDLANISLPIVLICASAAFNFGQIRSSGGMALKASFAQLVIGPALAVAIGLALGLHGTSLGILFLMNANSAAASSYVMAKAMGGNETAAAKYWYRPKKCVFLPES